MSQYHRYRYPIIAGLVVTVLVLASFVAKAFDGFLNPPGEDTFESQAMIELQIGDPPQQDMIELHGPVTLRRGDPQDTDGDGQPDTIPTEILAMELTGEGKIFGPVMVKTNPNKPSHGVIQGQSDGNGDLFYPAPSFFDVFFDIFLESEEQTLKNSEPMKLTGKASDSMLPDDPHQSVELVKIEDESQRLQGLITNFRWVPLPPIEKKISKVVIKKLNKIIRINLQRTHLSEPLVASKSIKVTVPANQTILIGADVPDNETNIEIKNPFRRDANVKICVDTTRFSLTSRLVFWLDIAGDGQYAEYATIKGGKLKTIQNTCAIVATREFRVELTNSQDKPVEAELAMIWTTGPVVSDDNDDNHEL